MMTSVTVLCLHRITDIKYPSWPGMPLGIFEKLLKHAKRNYRVCLPSDIQTDSKKKQLILTFDDGFEDFYLNAFPLLKKYKLPAVLNVVVKCITEDYQIWTQRLNDVLDVYAQHKAPFQLNIKDNLNSYYIDPGNAEKTSLSVFKQLLSVEKVQRDMLISKLEAEAPGIINRSKMMIVSQLQEVSEQGIMIGSHSMTHPNLQLKDSDTKILEFEIVESKNQLENLLGIKIESFAFPNGMYSDESIKIAKNSAYKYLFLVDNQIAHYNPGEETKVLDRILIYAEKHWKNIFRIHNYHNKIRKYLKN